MKKVQVFKTRSLIQKQHKSINTVGRQKTDKILILKIQIGQIQGTIRHRTRENWNTGATKRVWQRQGTGAGLKYTWKPDAGETKTITVEKKETKSVRLISHRFQN